MSRSLLYAVNSTDQTVAVGSTINFGAVVRRFGCNCTMNTNGNPVVSGNGYYSIDADIVFTASADGNAVITLYADGVAIPGAEATFTAASGDVYQIHIPGAVIREHGCCCDQNTVITAVLTGIAGAVNLVTLKLEKE